MEGRIGWTGDAAAFCDEAERWRQSGATHLSVNAMGAGLAGAEQHLAALEQAAGALGLKPSGPE